MDTSLECALFREITEMLRCTKGAIIRADIGRNTLKLPRILVRRTNAVRPPKRIDPKAKLAL